MPAIDAALQGTIESAGSQILTISGSAGTASFRIDLLERSGAATDSALQMRFANGVLCEGTLTALDTTGFTGTCAPSGGATRTVSADWTVADSTVTGTLKTAGETTAA